MSAEQQHEDVDWRRTFFSKGRRGNVRSTNMRLRETQECGTLLKKRREANALSAKRWD